MATLSSVTQQHILQALAEYDARAKEESLDVYGFAPSDDYPPVHDVRSYDSRAVRRRAPVRDRTYRDPGRGRERLRVP